MFEGLPEFCYGVLPADGDTATVILIKRGEFGYWPNGSTIKAAEAHAICDAKNAKIKVTKAQAEAMQMGSAFGWECPGANPANYEENGEIKEAVVEANQTTAMKQLEGKVVWDIPEEEDVIASGPITKQPSTMAYRVIIRVVESVQPFVVCRQCFPDYPSLKKSYFENGTYFYSNELDKAVECFGQKVAKHAGYLRSLYRDEVSCPGHTAETDCEIDPSNPCDACNAAEDKRLKQ